ncbi:MAG: hypothetical protein FK734_07135 [Asgard group archaeon]|nr:hypothetical protein [Asgard group archaeon]
MNDDNAKRSKRNNKKTKDIRQLEAEEKFYKRNFYLFEISYIILAVPIFILSLASIPLSLYYSIKQNFYLWPIVLVATLIVFVQILATQYFVKKFYLEPYDLTFGQYLRMRYEERYAAKEEVREIKTWYDNIDEFIVKIKTTQREQTKRIYALNYEHFNQSAE